MHVRPSHLHEPFDLCYPHILDGIIHAASPTTRLFLRLVSRNVRDRVDYHYPGHVMFTYDEVYFTVKTINPAAAAPLAAPSTSHGVGRILHHVDNTIVEAERDAGELSESQKRFAFLRVAVQGLNGSVSTARVLDVDPPGVVSIGHMMDPYYRVIHQRMPLLHTVRYVHQLHPKECPLSARRVVFFIDLPHAWSRNHNLFSGPTDGIERLVINIRSASIYDLSKVYNPSHWLFHVYKWTGPGKYELIDLPKEIVFILSSTTTSDESDEKVFFLRSICAHVTACLLWPFPRPDTRFVFVFTAANLAPSDCTAIDTYDKFAIGNAQRSDKAAATEDTSEAIEVTETTAANTGTTFKSTNDTTDEQHQKQYEDHIRTRKAWFKQFIIASTIRVIKESRPKPHLSPRLSFEWSEEAIAALDSRIEVLTDKEYKARVGEHSFRLETVSFTTG